MTKGSPTGKGGATASLARVAGNSGWSVVAFLVGIAANLITLPFVIRQLGIYAFGVCGLIVAISTPFTLVGTTIGQATAQGIARYRARGDETAVHDFCATIALVACAGITVTGVLLALLIPALVNVLYAQYKSTFVSAWMVGSLLAIGWMAQQFALVMQGVHIACQDYRRIAAVNGAAAILTPLTIITIVSVVGTAEAYIGALAVGYLLTSLVWVASLRAKFRWSLVAPRVHARVAHSIFSFTGWQMLAQLISSVAAQVDRYLLGSWVGGTAVGYYNVSQRLEEVAYIGVLKVGDALFPQFSANADEQLSRQADVFFRSAWMLNLVAAMVLGPLIPLAASILQVWVGPDMSTHAATVLRILTIAGLLGCAGNVFVLYSLGIAKTRYTATLSALTAVASAVTGIALLRRYGFAAAGMGAMAGMIVNLFSMLLLLRWHFKEFARMSRLLVSIVLPIGAAIATGALLAPFAYHYRSSWPILGLGYGLASLSILGVVLLSSALSVHGRASLSDLLRIAKLATKLVR